MNGQAIEPLVEILAEFFSLICWLEKENISKSKWKSLVSKAIIIFLALKPPIWKGCLIY